MASYRSPFESPPESTPESSPPSTPVHTLQPSPEATHYYPPYYTPVSTRHPSPQPSLQSTPESTTQHTPQTIRGSTPVIMEQPISQTMPQAISQTTPPTTPQSTSQLPPQPTPQSPQRTTGDSSTARMENHLLPEATYEQIVVRQAYIDLERAELGLECQRQLAAKLEFTASVLVVLLMVVTLKISLLLEQMWVVPLIETVGLVEAKFGVASRPSDIISHALLTSSSREVAKPITPGSPSPLGGSQRYLPSINWVLSRIAMAFDRSEERATNQEALDGILPVPGHIEVPPNPHSQHHPSRLSEDGTQDSGNEERRGDTEEDANEKQSDNGEQGENKAEGDNQNDGNETNSTNEEGDSKIEEKQEDENGAETRNPHEESEADGNQRSRDDAESVSQQDVQAAKTNIASMPEFGEVIGFGDRIPDNSIFPLLFTQSYLEQFKPDEVKRRIEAISAYSQAASQLGSLVKLYIFDLQVSVGMDMNIIFEGCSQLAEKVNSTSSHKICPLIFSDRHYMSYSEFMLRKLANFHVKCEERPRSIKRGVENSSRYIFHTTFFELQQSPTEEDYWASGRLYSLYNANRKPFRKACITICSFALEKEWAMAILAPSNFYSTPGFRPIVNAYGTVEVAEQFPLNFEFPAVDQEECRDTLLQAITKSVSIIVDHWQKLYDEVQKECNSENVSFMDGEQYVHLLYDDGTFRRSRFYFWAIGCLNSFEQSVAETLWELAMFRIEVDEKSPLGERVAAGSSEFKDIYNLEMEQFDQGYKNLEGIRDQLVKKRDEMKVLRDGLFSASSVMESRQSRILGENVQLLAFVTIFFLPLAFSASLWSIPGVNEKYPGITIPGASAAVIGFITYFIVFNLNLLISGLHRLFATPRDFLLKKMAAEKSPKSVADNANTTENNDKRPSTDWPRRAKAFEVFPRQDIGPRPSNWLLLFYAIRLLIIKVFDLVIGLLAWLRGIIAPNPTNKDTDTEKADRVPS
ncbi:hypothetical protein V495_07684 [Pseudogymnoascus sp. VKM F-4514 (FW-929)]|nr:hypothetical protein V495_07684 [Pseudogymnoascus sp. VKM F-4514 (FW-929)]KFY51726.1 hypothetical protein V497_08893 [Pseudogymnoascus sp. VKM F-4516 (FW-969)]